MSSENFICVRENKPSSDKSSLKLVDLRKGTEVSEKPMTAESAIMNPMKSHLALKAQNTIQVFDFDEKSKVSSLQVGYDIVYWTWLNSKKLLMVSEDSVFVWSYDQPDSVPLKWFDRSPSLKDCQIIGAESNESGKWCFITGISLKGGQIVGAIQLYNDEKKVSQIIEGHSGSFFQLQIDRNEEHTACIFAFASRSKISECKVHLIQIDSTCQTPKFLKKVIDLPTGMIPPNDFPIRVLHNPILNLVFIYTKFGTVFVVEPVTGTYLLNVKISENPIYLISKSSDTRYNYVLSRNGDVWKVDIDPELLFDACADDFESKSDAIGIFMNNLDINTQLSLYRNRFDALKNSGKYYDALLLVAKSGKPFMRSFEFLSSIKDFPNINDTSALLEYFAMVLESEKLNEVESLELVQLALKKKKLEIVRKWLDTDQIFCTSQLGKVILDSDVALALVIFEKAKAEDMITICYALLGKYEEFKIRLGKCSSPINVQFVLAFLLKENPGSIPEFLKIVSSVQPDYIDEAVAHEIMKIDSKLVPVEIYDLFLSRPGILKKIRSSELNTSIAKKFIEIGESGKLSEFIKICEDQNIAIEKTEILPLLDISNNPSLVFSFESNLEKSFNICNSVVGSEDDIKTTSLSASDVKKLILRLIDEDPDKFGKLCLKMSEFIDIKDFKEVRNILKEKIEESLFFYFLIFWAQKIGSDEIDPSELLESAINLGSEEKLVELCSILNFSNPKDIFIKISEFDSKSKALQEVASRYNLVVELILLYEKNNLSKESKEFFAKFGQELLWNNLSNLASGGVSKEFLVPIIEIPEDVKLIQCAGSGLASVGRLSFIEKIILNPKFDSEPQMVPIKLKLLCETNESKFLAEIQKADMKNIDEDILEYCEKKNSHLAMKLYSSLGNFNKLLNVSLSSDKFDALVEFIINSRNSEYWAKLLNCENSVKVFELVIEKADSFPDTDSASCLIKVLVSQNNSELLLKMMSSWLKLNDKLRQSRSLQTLYAINLIKFDIKNFEEELSQLESYNVEEVLHSLLDCGELKLAVSILEKHKLWSYAFKIALYGLKDLNLAKKYAELSGHTEAWHALAEYCLILGDCSSATDFAKNAKLFRRSKELIVLLRLNEKYEDLLVYLSFLKSTQGLEPVFERELFYCLMKLGKNEEIKDLVDGASPSFANELGKILYREGSIELAAKCFNQAKNYEMAAKSYLQLDKIDLASECAGKSNSIELWLKIVQKSLLARKFSLAQKFALKCSQNTESIETIMNIYEESNCLEELSQLIDLLIDSSVPQPATIYLIGDFYCRIFPEKLELLVSKYYASVSSSFFEILVKYRRWKEAYKLFLLRSNLDEALTLVMKHPSIEFDHRKLTAVIGKIKGQKCLESLLEYYFEFEPRRLIELQEEFAERLGFAALMSFFQEKDVLFALDKFMRRYQSQNPTNAVVAAGFNEHLIKTNDYYGLIESIKKCPSIDVSTISESLKSSEHRHFRVLAAKLIGNSGDFTKSLSILVEEDALIETMMVLSQSNNVLYADAILSRYAKNRNAVMFMAVIYLLYDLLRPDVIYEQTQHSGFQDISLPVFCQIMRHKLK